MGDMPHKIRAEASARCSPRWTIVTGLRVVQWATGNIGSRSLRHIIQHPGLTLAGVYVTSTAKVGRDAGELCGLPPTGVTATGDIGEILALGADCVLYMPADCDLDQVCAILAAGTNIVTTRGEFLHPGSMSPADRERVEQACAEGGTSIHGTGSSPGFISEALPLVLTSIQRRLDALTINEYADVSSRDSPEMLFDLMGFGHPANEFPPERFAYGAYSFGPSMRLVAEAVGLRMIVTGTRAGRALMTFTATWYCTANLEPAWTVRGNGWNILVEGDAPLDIDVRFACPVEQMAEMTPGYTANRAVNAVPYVCAAAPGIRTTVDLPQIIPALGG